MEADPKLILRVSDSLMLANEEPVKTANAEILCNCDDINELIEEEKRKRVDNHGRIIFREYLNLLTTEEAKVEFILKVLTKAVNERTIFAIYGIFPALRKPLGRRGWVEKRFVRRMLSMSPDISEGCRPELVLFGTKPNK